MRLSAPVFFKKKKNLALILLFSVVSFLAASPALAWDGDWMGRIVGALIGVIISALGLILILVIKALLLIATYQQFTTSQAVIEGWAIVRDFANMFFVVILLIIAFATILHIEKYNYKKWLPKLILMAILINFSKTICGVLIDIAQIVMLTFINAIKDVAGGNFIDMLGITDIVTMAKNTDGVGFWTIVGAYFLGLIYMVIALVVLATMTMMLAMRLVMIWIYVVLSPLAYLLAAFPDGASYASKWWKEFTQNLIVGPVLAFFIWLSFAALQTGSDMKLVQNANDSQADITSQAGAISSPDGESYGEDIPTKAGTPGVLVKFIIGIGMLLGGLKIAQEIGGAAGSMAGKGMAKINQIGVASAGLAVAAVRNPMSYGVEKLHQKTGVDLNVKRVYEKMREESKERKAKHYLEGQNVARKKMDEGSVVGGMLAITGNPKDAYNRLTTARGWRNMFTGGARMERNAEAGLSEKEALTAQLDKDKDRQAFEVDFMKADPVKRSIMEQDAILNRDIAQDDIKLEEDKIKQAELDIATEEAKMPELQDKNKINNLKSDIVASKNNIKQHEMRDQELEDRQKFMKIDPAKVYDQKEIDTKRVADITKNKETQSKIEKAQKKINRNIPEYAFDARSADSALVNKEMSKIKDIDDASELLRALESAIKNKEKSMVKAIVLKMSKDGNDNEFLKPLAGRTDYKGLQKLMRDFSDSSSKNYAGFDQQEAFSLGSQVAEINKGTHHWDATHAYEMENGKWKEMDAKTHAQYTDGETSKIQLQEMMRKFNRLAYGFHDAGGNFHISANGFINLKKIDSNAGHKNTETMNINAIRFLHQAIKENTKLEAYFSQDNAGDGKSLMRMFEERMAKSQGFMKDYEDSFNYLQ